MVRVFDEEKKDPPEDIHKKIEQIHNDRGEYLQGIKAFGDEVKVNPNIPEEQREDLVNILDRYIMDEKIRFDRVDQELNELVNILEKNLELKDNPGL